MAFRASFVKNIIYFAGQRGADPEDLLQAVQCQRMEDLDNEELFFNRTQYERVMQIALRQSSDPHLGLHLGEFLSLSAAGLIVQIAQNSRTVLEALQYTVEFANLGCQELPFQLKELDQAWELSLHPHPEWENQYPLSVHQTMDGMMVFTLREFQSITLQKHQPISVHFSYANPSRQAEYQRIFNCPIRLGTPKTAFYLKKEQVEDQVTSSDYQLLKMLVHYAQQKLESMAQQDDLAHRIRKTILNMAHSQFPTIQEAAANLNLSVRTLQRRLKSENYTYQELTDELKRQFALNYLRNDELSIKEIAYSLNFAEASSFIRSFNRWFGVSPQTYRQQHFLS
jgi:AraC-like DNA-binding protein